MAEIKVENFMKRSIKHTLQTIPEEFSEISDSKINVSSKLVKDENFNGESLEILTDSIGDYTHKLDHIITSMKWKISGIYTGQDFLPFEKTSMKSMEINNSDNTIVSTLTDDCLEYSCSPLNDYLFASYQIDVIDKINGEETTKSANISEVSKDQCICKNSIFNFHNTEFLSETSLSDKEILSQGIDMISFPEKQDVNSPNISELNGILEWSSINVRNIQKWFNEQQEISQQQVRNCEKLLSIVKKLLNERNTLKNHINKLEEEEKELRDKLQRYPKENELSWMREEIQQLKEKLYELNEQHIDLLRNKDNLRIKLDNISEDTLLASFSEELKHLKDENKAQHNFIDIFEKDAKKSISILLKRFDFSNNKIKKLNKLLKKSRISLNKKYENERVVDAKLQEQNIVTKNLKEKLFIMKEELEEVMKTVYCLELNSINTSDDADNFKIEAEELIKNFNPIIEQINTSKNLKKQKKEKLLEINSIFKYLNKEKCSIKKFSKHVNRFQKDIMEEEIKIRNFERKPKTNYMNDDKAIWHDRMTKLLNFLEQIEEVLDISKEREKIGIKLKDDNFCLYEELNEYNTFNREHKNEKELKLNSCYQNFIEDSDTNNSKENRKVWISKFSLGHQL